MIVLINFFYKSNSLSFGSNTFLGIPNYISIAMGYKIYGDMERNT